MKILERMSPLKRFFNLLKVEKQQILSIYVYALFNGVVALSLPLGIQAIISLISGGQVSSSWIVLVILVITGVALSGVMQIMQLSISENLQQKIFTRSAFEFAYRIPRMRLEAVDKFYAPELVNRFFDTLSVQKGLSKMLMDFSSASLQIVFGLILLSVYHPFFILFSILLLLIVYLIFRFTAPVGLKTSLLESKRKYEVVHWLEELARTMETFKLAGNVPLPLEKTDELVSGYLSSRKAHFKTLVVQYVNLVAFKVIIAAGLLLIGGLLVINQQMNIGQFVASEIIIILVLASVEKLILSMETIYDVLTAIEKLGGVTDIPLDSEEGERIEVSHSEALSVNVNKLSYRFLGEQEESLQGVSLNISAGEKLCVSGFEASGKSLLLQMIAGLYDEFRGSISFNDIPLSNWNKSDLHKLIGDNLSKEDIFNGTLLENITIGDPDISLQDVKEAAKVVGLSKFVDALPNGYHTKLLAEGKNLSKSIRLRIMLVRSFIGTPKLILLGNNFNMLNTRDRERFLDYLLQLKATVIVISNNSEVAAKFNRTVVLKNGELLANAPYSDLKSFDWYTSVFQKL